jgi:hypothetical protein
MLSELEIRVQELKANQETFLEFLRVLDETQISVPAVTEEYSPKQVLAHIVGADTSMLRMVKNWIAGTETKIRPDFDLNYFNQRQQEKRANQSVQELIEDWQRAQRALIEVMETVTPEDLDKHGDHPRASNTTLRNLFLIMTSHEAEHINQVMSSIDA